MKITGKCSLTESSEFVVLTLHNVQLTKIKLLTVCCISTATCVMYLCSQSTA